MDHLVYMLNLPLTVGHLFAVIFGFTCGWLAFKIVRTALSFMPKD